MRNVVPMPVYKALSVLSAERRQKIVNINEKIHSHKLNIKSNEQKILKQQSRAENCKKSINFLTIWNPWRQERKLCQRYAGIRDNGNEDNLWKVWYYSEQTRCCNKSIRSNSLYVRKLKLRKQIDKLTNKKEKLINKLKALNEWSDKFESVKTMPDKEADNIISKSCQNIVDEFTNNPQALKSRLM